MPVEHLSFDDVPELAEFSAVIVGAGLFGLTVAERVTTETGTPVLIIERRASIGGNVRSAIDEESGIEVHLYGPHIFHTSNERIWNYVRNFTDFNDYRHHVWSHLDGRLHPLPISSATLSSFFQRAFSPEETKQYFDQIEESTLEVSNFESRAISSIGRELYEAFFEGYTAKQWQTSPRDLPAETFGRLPIRTTLNTRYFSDRYEGIPSEGYTAWVERLAASPLIHVALNTSWHEVRDEIQSSGHPIVYSGPLDGFFDYSEGRLGWRTLDFEFETIGTEDFQGTAVINFPSLDVPFTRIVEYQHFHPEWTRAEGSGTIISKEHPRFATDGDEPFYPINSSEDSEKLSRYREAAKKLKNVVFGGRLGGYKYLDMHMAIGNALTKYDTTIAPMIEAKR